MSPGYIKTSISELKEDISLNSSPDLSPLEMYDPLPDRMQVLKLKKWNTFWKYTTGCSVIFGAISFVLAAMVVSYSHNPTFVNDFLITSFMGSWYTPTLQIDPLSPQHHHSMLPGVLTVETLNRGKPVLPVHSHNDYWRRVPFFEAISLGCQSVEADVWKLQGKEHNLYVGHHKRSLSSFKTLHNMYLEPLESLLDTVNAHDVFLGDDVKLGVFDSDPSATLYFVLDVKNDPEGVFELIERSFDRFYKKGYLTTFDTSTQTWSYGPVTLIISGDAPVEKIKSQRIRTMFVDAPMKDIVKDDKLQQEYSSETGMAIFASASLVQLTGSRALRYSGGLSVDEQTSVQTAIDLAHEMGLKIRVWETPDWPMVQRDQVWSELLDLGVDLINANDLHAAAQL